jgi:hypothetical protein
MGNLFKNTKVLGGIGAAVLIGVLLYYYYGGSGSSATLTQPGSSPASEELLLTLGSLRSITLDPSVLEDPLFAALSDFGVTIPSQPTGRRNPFAPVGVGGGL